MRSLAVLAMLAVAATAPAEALRLRTVTGDPLDPSSQLAGKPKDPASRYRLVQFDGPLGETRHAECLALGWEFVGIVPPSAYVVRMPPGSTPKGVRWNGSIAPWWKIDSALAHLPKSSAVEAMVILWPGEDADAAARALETLGADVIRSTSATAEVMAMRIDAAGLEDAAAVEAVQWIEPVPRLSTRNNTVAGVVQSGEATRRPLWDRGLRGQGQVLGHIDTALDFSSCYLRDAEGDPFGTAHRKIQGFRGTGTASNHGTHTAATAVGRNLSGSDQNAGVAPDARLTHGVYTSLIPSWSVDVARNFTDFVTMLEASRDDGAAVHSNSWGDDERADYIWLSAAVDDFCWRNENALVLVAATNGPTLAAPENAKNALTVGSTRRWDAIGEFHSGGAGPTRDGRRKPEIYAPGQATVSALAGACNVGQLSGTSMATPAVAGAAMLARQYFMEGWHPTGRREPANALTPSGALLKAVLLNSTVDMEGLDGWPGDREGWGRLVLDDTLFLEGDTRTLWLRDARRSGGMGLGDGGAFEHALALGAGALELRVTLAWMDPPASHLAETVVVNDLDLEVVGPGGEVHRGNFLVGGVSAPGGEPDPLNNVEQVLLRGLPPGVYTLRVAARRVDPVAGAQGYALVARVEHALAGWIAR